MRGRETAGVTTGRDGAGEKKKTATRQRAEETAHTTSAESAHEINPPTPPAPADNNAQLYTKRLTEPRTRVRHSCAHTQAHLVMPNVPELLPSTSGSQDTGLSFCCCTMSCSANPSHANTHAKLVATTGSGYDVAPAMLGVSYPPCLRLQLVQTRPTTRE